MKNPSQRFARVLHREWWKRYNRTQPKRKNDKKRTGRGGAGTGGGWMRRWGRSRRWRRRLVHGRTKGETLDERSSQSEERGGGGCGWCTKCVCVCVCVCLYRVACCSRPMLRPLSSQRVTEQNVCRCVSVLGTSAPQEVVSVAAGAADVSTA